MFFMKNITDLNNKDMQPGQTLFQYLKRKKHIALKQSLQNSFQKSDIKPKQNQYIKQSLKIQKQIEIKQSSRQASTKRRGKKSSNKKKKVDHSFDSKKQNNNELSNLCHDIFKQQKTARRSFLNTGDLIFQQKYEPAVRKTPTRSFMSMISPLKNQASLSTSHTKTQYTSNIIQRRGSNKMAEFSSKKIIKETMTKVQTYYHGQITFEKQVKQKFRQFFLLLNSVLVQLQDFSSNWISDGLDKKMKQLRSNMKLINGFIMSRQNKQKQNINQMIDSLYISLNQVLDSYEGQVKTQSQSNCQSIMSKAKNQYQKRIDELIKQKNSLTRQINFSNKENQKLQKEYNKLLEKFNTLQQTNQLKTHHIQMQEKQMFQLFEQKNQQLTIQNKQLKQKVQLLEKKLKDSEYKFQEYSRKVNIDHQQKLNQRQNYLLKEINLLKSQCARDIKNLNQYYTSKQDIFPKKIKDLQIIITQQSLTIKKLENTLKQTQNLIKLQQVNFKESKRKVDEVLLDLYRINQQLYKHWSALKDVKTLLSRLNMYDKFERIYKDIPFDDLLFLS